MRIKKIYQGELPENKILNVQSDSSTDTYSCDYINNLGVGGGDALDELPIGSVIRYDGEDIPEGWEEVEDSSDNVYSEEETVIGTYLGKPIYRKIVTATLPSVQNSWTKIVSNITTNIDKLITIRSFYHSTSDQFPIPISEGTYFINLKMNGNDLYCNRSGFGEYTCPFVVEYTKTTD